MQILVLFLTLMYGAFHTTAGFAALDATNDRLCQNSHSVFVNATFLTMNAQQPTANAVAVSNHRIVAVGNQDELLAHCKGAQTKIIDLNQATVTPGFINTHSQSLLYGWLAEHALDLSTTNVFMRPDWKPIKNTTKFLAAIQAHINQSDGKQEWVFVSGYDEARIAGKPLTQAMLDEMDSNIPILVFFASGKTGLLNQAAIAKLQSHEQTKRIQIDYDGQIKEGAFYKLLAFFISGADATKAIQTAANAYARQGYTTIADSFANPEWALKYNELTAAKTFPVDILYSTRSGLERNRFGVLYQDNNRLYRGPLLLEVDGMAQEYGAFLNLPYIQQPSFATSNWYGALTKPASQIETEAAKAMQANIPLALEAHGDAAIDFILNALQKLERGHDAASPLILTNVQYIREDQLTRLKSLNVSIDWNGPFLYYWGESMCQERLGPERALLINPLTTALNNTALMSVHIHSPSTPPVPIEAINWLASRKVQRWNHPANRRCPQYFAINQRISAEQALELITINAARLYGMEQDKGSIEVGKLADMTILNRSPLQKDERLIHVLATVSHGVLHKHRT